MCEKHPKRRQSNCKDCYPEAEQTILDIKQEQEFILNNIIDTDNTINAENNNEQYGITSVKFNEKVYIQALIEKEMEKVIHKLKSEISTIKDVKWEHLQMPLTCFSMDALRKLETEGWKYIDMIHDPKLYQYSGNEPFVLLQRVVRDSNPPIPKNFKKYMEK